MGGSQAANKKVCFVSKCIVFAVVSKELGGNVNNLCMLCLHDMQMILMDKTKFEVSEKNVPTRGPLSSHRQSDKISNIVIFTEQQALVTQRAMEVWAKKALS